MNNPDIIYRPYKLEDLKRYQIAYQEVFNFDFNEKFFKWKHAGNVAKLGKPLIYVACTKSGRIVGANSFFWDEVLYRGQTYSIVQSGDSFVVPDFRGKSLFTSILKFAYTDLAKLGCLAVIGFANDNSVRGFLKTGNERVAGSMSFILDQRYLAALSLVPGINDVGFGIYRAWQKKRIQDTNVVEINLKDNDLEEFLDTEPRNEARIKKTKEFFERKYLTHPYHQFECYQVQVKGQVSATFILEVEHIKKIFKKGKIVEFFCQKESDLGVCLQALSIHLAKIGFAQLTLWISEFSKYRDQLELFSGKPKPLHFVVKLLGDVPFMLSGRNWEFFPGDADTV